MRIQDLNGKNVCILGFGREGQAMFQALKQYAPSAIITIADRDKAIAKVDGAQLLLGDHHQDTLQDFDVIIRSSGIKDSSQLNGVVKKTTDMTRVFFDSIAGSGVRTIGITGSKGKSTTSSLIYAALKAHSPNTWLMGNIGTPMILFLEHAKPGNTFVIELSSYMLEHLRVSPNIAVVTSFFPEHLDRHGSLGAYWAAKKNIAAFQTTEDCIFYNATYPKCKEIADASQGTKIPFTASDFPIALSETKFSGEHNRSNLAAAFKVATFLDVPENTALDALKNADPLPHRLQNLGIHGGVTWVNDSFSTAPESTIAGIEALDGTVDTLLVGGVDRGVDFSGIAKYLAKSNVRNIVIFPDSGLKIRDLMAAHPHNKNFYETTDMANAVQWAAANTAPGKTVLLSSASPSFNLFKDFVARGEAFISAVQNIDN